jgi:pimeloyl-ACP methyl ester carboxylesterase
MTSPRKRLGRNASLVVLGFAAVLGSMVRRDLPTEELKATLATEGSTFESVDGLSVHVRDGGAGPPLLLIHGTSSSLHTWDGWVTRLKANRRVIRLDLPGFGLTEHPGDHDYRATRLARTARALLDRKGIDRADVAGNSLGGRVALTLALESPARVRKLVLIDAAGLSGQKPPPIFRLARTPVLGQLLRFVTPRFLVAKNVREVYGDPARVTDAVVDRYYALARREGNREALLARLNGAQDPPLDDRLGEIVAPTLIEWGGRDSWIPPVFAARLAGGIRGSRVVTYPDAGHVPMEEIPAETAADAEAFLRE